MMKTYEAYTAVCSTPIKTFSHFDMAERYKDDMAKLGADITIKTRKISRAGR